MPNLSQLVKAGVLFRTAWATPLVLAHAGHDPHRPLCVPDRCRRSDPEASQGQPRAFPERAHPARGLHSGQPALPARPYRQVARQPGRGPRQRSGPEPARLAHFSGPDPDLPFLPSYYSWPKTVDGTTQPSTVYATSDQVDDAIGFIRQAKDKERP